MIRNLQDAEIASHRTDSGHIIRVHIENQTPGANAKAIGQAVKDALTPTPTPPQTEPVSVQAVTAATVGAGKKSVSALLTLPFGAVETALTNGTINGIPCRPGESYRWSASEGATIANNITFAASGGATWKITTVG